MAELKEFKLPDVGEGLTEADIVAWHVKPGDRVEDGQIIVEIETAKAVVELPSPWDGTVARLLAEEGQTVDVGVPIIVVEVGGSAEADRDKTDYAERSAVTAPAAADKPERQAVLVGYGVKASATTRRPRKTVPHQTVPHQVCRMESDRLLQLQQLVGAVIGSIEFPPELEPEQAFVEPA